MATDTLTLKFKGIDEVTPATKSINTSLDGLGKSASTIAKGALAAVAVGAAAISVELYSAAKAAMEAEENMARLKKALENSGQATKSNLDALVEQSAELQRTTKYSDDAIQSLQALALNLGASAEETKTITQASTDMAAALGVDANTATRLLTLSLQGQTIGLGKLIPEVKNMTDAQLAHGDAIALVAKKYQGFAENEGQTFAGTLAKVSNAFGDLQEEIGAIFTDNEGLKDTLAGLVPILDDIKTLVIENKDGMRDMVTYGLTLVINSFAMMAEGGVVVVDTLFALMEGYKRAAIALDEFNQKITPWETSGISDRIAEAKAELAGIVQMREQFAQTGTKIFGIAEAAKELAEQAGKANYQQEQTAIVMDEVIVKTDRYKQRLDAMTKSTKNHNDELEKQLTFYSELYGSAMYSNISDISKELEQLYGARPEDQPGASSPSETASQTNEPSKWSEFAGAAGSGNISNMITSAISIALPGIGAAIASAMGPVLDIMATGTRKDLDKFFEGMANQIENIISNIGNLVMSIIEHVDDFIVAIVAGIGELITQLPEILISSISSIGTIVGGVFEGLGKVFVDVGTKIYEGITGTTLAVEKGFAFQVNNAAIAAGYYNVKDVEAAYGRGDLSLSVAADYIRSLQDAQRSYAEDYALLTMNGRRTWSESPSSMSAIGSNVGNRAFGGPVTAGQPYIVGDGQDGSMRNAEVFVPSKSGTIMPKGSNGGANINVNITADPNPRVTAQYVTSAVKYLIDSKQWRFDPIRNLAVA